MKNNNIENIVKVLMKDYLLKNKAAGIYELLDKIPNMFVNRIEGDEYPKILVSIKEKQISAEYIRSIIEKAYDKVRSNSKIDTNDLKREKDQTLEIERHRRTLTKLINERIPSNIAEHIIEIKKIKDLKKRLAYIGSICKLSRNKLAFECWYSTVNDIKNILSFYRDNLIDDEECIKISELKTCLDNTYLEV